MRTLRVRAAHRFVGMAVGVAVLLLTFASPSLAAEWERSRTFFMEASGEVCAAGLCTSHDLTAQSPSVFGGPLAVCLRRQTWVEGSDPLQIVAEERGCATVPARTIVVVQLNPLLLRLMPTQLTLLDDVDGSTQTLVVAMRQKARTSFAPSRGTESFIDQDGCLVEVQFVHRSDNAHGWFSVDGQRFDNRWPFGSVVFDRNRVRVTCP